MKKLNLLVLLSVTLSLTAPFTGCSKSLKDSQKTVRSAGLLPTAVTTVKASTLTVAALTDFHGALLPSLSKNGEPAKETGGAANLASYIKILREKNSDNAFIVVDGGDLFQGSMESNLAEGKPVVEFYNYLGVAATALGNHEFDFGPEGVDKTVPRGADDDARGALKARMKEAHFPILAINLVDENGQRPDWIKGSTVVESKGVRVGVIGAASVQTPSTTIKANIKDLRFLDPKDLIVAEAARLRAEENVDAVVLAYHEGGVCGKNVVERQDNLDGCNVATLFDMIKAMPEGTLDVVVAGHVHQGIAKRIGRTVVLESFSHGRELGWATVKLAAAVGEKNENSVAGFEAVVKPAMFLGEEVVADEAVLTMIAPDVERVSKIKNASLEIKATAPFKRSYDQENELGNMIADEMLLAYPEAQIAVTNGGGLRANLPKGELSYGHIFEVLPFDNRVAFITVSGETLKHIVEIGEFDGHGSLSWGGLSFVAKDCAIETITVAGKPLALDATYVVVTSDYLATGGSGFDKASLKEEQVRILWDGATILRDVVAEQLKASRKDIDPKDYFSSENRRARHSGRCGK